MRENVAVLTSSNNKTTLAKLEALLIKQHSPVINKQVKNFLAYLKNMSISLRILHTRTRQKNVTFCESQQAFSTVTKKEKIENIRKFFK